MALRALFTALKNWNRSSRFSWSTRADGLQTFKSCVAIDWRSDIIDSYKQIYNLFRAFIFEKNVRLNIGFETGLNWWNQ